MEQTIVLYPFPEIGHLVSMVELGKLILHHYPQTTITILLVTGPFNTPGTTSYIRFISRTHPSISFHRFPPLDAPSPSPTWSHAARWFSYINSNAPNVLNSLREISKTSAVRALVIDLFCTSALVIGKELSIPTYYFFTSGAAILASYFFFPKIHEQTTLSFKDMKGTVFSFPGLPPIKATHMVEPTLDREDPAYDGMLYFFSNLPKSEGILVNTFEELEPKAVSVLDSGMCAPDSKIPPVYYIGPLLAPRSKDDGPSLEEIDCLSWLERQPSRSVVFLCFGSRGSFSAAQVKEIAVGLEMSSQRFLWVVKSPPLTEGGKQNIETTEFDLDSMLPDGFLERTKERGLVVKTWAPQVAVLSQESVGGFVTHCGWNSVLESVVAGVPMVAWPLYAEQHMNRTILVEQMEMAIPLDQREDDGFVTAAELEKRLRELMGSEHGQQLRQRSQEMKERALDARGESGSSTRAIAELIQIWQEG